jgi:hypothetical protein
VYFTFSVIHEKYIQTEICTNYDVEWNKDKEKYEIEDNEERAVYEDVLYDDS